MTQRTIKAVELVRQIRDQNYEILKDKSREEIKALSSSRSRCRECRGRAALAAGAPYHRKPRLTTHCSRQGKPETLGLDEHS